MFAASRLREPSSPPAAPRTQRALAPSDPRYSALELANEEKLRPQEVFEREPRDAVYAPIFERRLDAGYRQAFATMKLDARVLGVTVQCKTLSCRTYVEVAEADALYVHRRINSLVLGNRHSPELIASDVAGRKRISFHTLFEADMRRDDVFEAYVRDTFPQLIETMLQIYPPE